MDTQSFMYQLTINDPIEKGYTHERIVEIIQNNFKTITYFCMCDEKGSCYHTHIFIVFTSRVRFSTVKRYFTESHIEKCKGNVSANISYIKKEGEKWAQDTSKQEKKIEGTFEEYGTPPPDSKGKRTDMSELYQMVSEGMSTAEIIAYNQDNLLYLNHIERLRTILLTEKFKDSVRLDLQVIYVCGKTGAGKTREIFESNGYSSVYRVTDYTHPFDGYSCQPVICFDEFRDSLKLKDMLMYCDVYPLELPSRYANKYASYNRVYIVSNWMLEKQYEEAQRNDKESWEAFLRRIHKVIVYEDVGCIKEYKSVSEYLERSEFKKLTDNDDIPFK